MEINNELRRTKQKLELFEGEQPVYWLLSDLLDLLVEQGHLDGGTTEEWKQKKINELRKGYKKFIQDNKPKNSKQQNLFK